ncbi:RNT1 Ribonuclease 3 [Candida maltosa Xu316]
MSANGKHEVARITDDDFKAYSVYHEPVFDKDPKNVVGVLDQHRLEYAMRQLQKNISTVIQQSPDISELQLLCKSSNVDNGSRVLLENSELMATASKLKTLYKIGKLPILDGIVKNDIALEKGDEKLLAENAPTLENLNFTLPTVSGAEISPNGVDNTLPELPSIDDRSLYEKVFTHRSSVSKKSYLDVKDLIHSHNERLEFLGDSILNNLVTGIIYKEFPDCNEGDLSKIRSHLVSNKTLIDFALQYGFDKRLRTGLSEESINKGSRKLYADAFEAYIGALSMSGSIDIIREWLAKLYVPLIDDLKSDYNKEPLNKNARSELYALIGTPEMCPQYETVHEGDGIHKKYTVQCLMNGELMGRGTEYSFKDACARAAMEALNNKAMLNKYFVEFRSVDATRREERNAKEQLKKEEKLKRLQESHEADIASLPSTPPSPINTSIFPLPTVTDTPLDIEAKNKLYGLLGKKVGVAPEYFVVSEINGLQTVELRIRNIIISQASDSSKKKAMARAAQTLLENETALKEICKDFRTKKTET